MNLNISTLIFGNCSYETKNKLIFCHKNIYQLLKPKFEQYLWYISDMSYVSYGSNGIIIGNDADELRKFLLHPFSTIRKECLEWGFPYKYKFGKMKMDTLSNNLSYVHNKIRYDYGYFNQLKDYDHAREEMKKVTFDMENVKKDIKYVYLTIHTKFENFLLTRDIEDRDNILRKNNVDIRDYLTFHIQINEIIDLYSMFQ